MHPSLLMLVNFLKFFHLLLALGVLAGMFYCLAAIRTHNFNQVSVRINRVTIIHALLATITGTLLVYPKHYTFHTPWIQAAYLFMGLVTGILILLIVLRNNKYYRAICSVAYLLIVLMLMGVVHDAVTKVTLW